MESNSDSFDKSLVVILLHYSKVILCKTVKTVIKIIYYVFLICDIRFPFIIPVISSVLLLNQSLLIIFIW